MATKFRAPIEDELARQLLEAAPVIVLVLDREGRVMRVNPFFLELSGYALSEVVGREWIEDFVPERVREKVRGVLERARHGQPAHGVISPVRMHDGAERVIEWHSSVLDSTTAKEAALLAVGFDVTDRVAAVEALRRSRAQLNEAQRIAKLGSWTLDLTTDKLWWSDEIYRIFEIDPTRFGASYEAFLDAVHPDDRDAVHRAFTASVESHEPYDIVHRLKLTSGITKWVHERCETRYEDGHPLYSTGTVQDITEQVLARRTLEESQSAYRRLYEAARLKESAIDATPNAVAFWTFDGALSYVNPSFLRMWGYSDPDEILGHSILELVANPEDAEALMTGVLRGELRRTELTARRTDEEEFKILVSTSTLRDAQDEPVQIMGAFIDLTDRIRAEEEARHARDVLRLVVDSSPDWIFATDVDHRFVFVNEAFAGAHHSTPREMEGRFDTEFAGGELSKLRRHEGRVLRGETVHVAREEIRSDGRPRVLDTWKVPLRDESGAIHGVLSYCREVSPDGESDQRPS